MAVLASLLNWPVNTPTTVHSAVRACRAISSTRAVWSSPGTGMSTITMLATASREALRRTASRIASCACWGPWLVSTLPSETAGSMPRRMAESSASWDSANALETTATRLFRGTGWLSATAAMSSNCSAVPARITPAWRNIASKAPGGACVVRPVCPGGNRNPVTSDLATMTGLERESLRAIRENFRGLPTDCRYRPHTVVVGSSSQYCIMSLPETSARLPAER